MSDAETFRYLDWETLDDEAHAEVELDTAYSVWRLIVISIRELSSLRLVSLSGSHRFSTEGRNTGMRDST